jgi:predicted RNase H-like HicB family nuclease
MMQFPVVIHKDPDSDYGVTVPDLPACFSAGSTMEEALAQVVEAIGLHLDGMLLDNEALPTPQSIENHQKNLDYRDGEWVLVQIDPSDNSRNLTPL